ncbi:MAG: flagellar basal body P-ring formation chaperone FlgA [bacterium]
MNRSLLTLLVAIMGLALPVSGVLLTRASAADFDADIVAIDEHYPLATASQAEFQATLDSLVATHPEAFPAGARVITTTVPFPPAPRVAGPYVLAIAASPHSALNGFNTLQATLTAGTATLGRVALGSYFELQAPCVVTAETVYGGTTLQPSQLEIQWVSVRGKQIDQLFADPSELAGQTLSRGLAAGLPIERRYLASPLLVSRGAMVNVTVTVGGLTLTTKAKALESGALGQLIKLENPGSGSTLLAQVTGTNEAVVQ